VSANEMPPLLFKVGDEVTLNEDGKYVVHPPWWRDVLTGTVEKTKVERLCGPMLEVRFSKGGRHLQRWVAQGWFILPETFSPDYQI
jgi:hypothetical protein